MKSYFALRQRMYGAQINQKDIARYLNKSIGYVSDRFTLNHSWDLEDVYRICELLEIEETRIPEFFPRLKRT